MVAVISWIFLFQLWPPGYKSESKNSNSYFTLTCFLRFNVLDPQMNIIKMEFAGKKLKKAFISLSRGLYVTKSLCTDNILQLWIYLF